MRLQDIQQNFQMNASGIMNILRKYSYYFAIALVFIASCILFDLANLFHNGFEKVMSVVTYLAWHNLFEFTGALIAFSVFFVPYYTYYQDRNLRAIVVGSTFLTSGILDIFHTLSFRGMPEFLGANDAPNRATTLWIISRLVISVGLLVSSCIDPNTKAKVNKRIFLAIAVVISFSSLIIVTYYPSVIPPMYIEGTGLTAIKKSLEYIVMVTFAITFIRLVLLYRKTGDELQILFSISLLLNIFAEFAFVSYYSVYDVFNYLGHIYKFIASFVVFRAVFIHSVQKPYAELHQARQRLQAYVENLDRIVDARTRELQQINRKLIEDLDYARDIQKAMLPSMLPRENEVCFDARYFPAERVSGDFYNIFKLDEQHIGVYIGDVCGHGVPAAMLTVFLNQSIKMINDEDPDRSEITNPATVLKNVYKAFNDTNFRDEIYLVMLYGIYNTKNRKFEYASAGINVPPLIVKSDGTVEELSVAGFPICKFAEFYSGDYEDTSIQLEKGDKILFYTDGLVEAENGDGDAYSEHRLKQVVKENFQMSDGMMAEEISKSVFSFAGEKPLKDDITYCIMEVR